MPNPISIATQLLESVGAIFGLRWGTEEPSYTVQARIPGLEVRRYGPRVAAETEVHGDDASARNIGFRRLASYIFGDNRRNEEIAMTAPVAQRAGQRIAMTAPVAQSSADTDGSVIRFFMPSKWALATLPTPNDPAVRLVDVPDETVAVLRFSGDRSPREVERRCAAALKALRDSGYQAAGEPVAWFYDPPWTLPFRRRNEIAVPVRTP